MSADLKTKIADKTALVGVIGLGYVGLPLIDAFTRAGFRCQGFDVDQAKVDALLAGQSYIKHIPAEKVAGWIDKKQLEPTSDMSRLSESDVLLICVPTPLDKARDPDLRYVELTGKAIAASLRPGQMVILESTTYPSTTRDVLLPILEESGLACGSEFFLAYSPEREDPGNPDFSAAVIPKVVGGMDEASKQLACDLYQHAIVDVVAVSSPEVAEAAKILENTYRAVNIALVNELKVLFDRMGIDIWEVVDAAKTKPFGFQAFYPGPGLDHLFQLRLQSGQDLLRGPDGRGQFLRLGPYLVQPFYPGPGLGGHCIPIDPFYLSWLARRQGLNTRFIELAGEVNSQMPRYVISRVAEFLNEAEKPIRGSRICILGMAYKKDVDDPRESPSFELMELLLERGAVMTYNDPHIPRLPKMRHFDVPAMDSTELTPEFLQSQDCVLIATDHSAYDYDQIVANSLLVVDTRNATVAVADWRERIRKA